MKKLLRLKHWQVFIILTISIFLSTIFAVSHVKIGDLDSIKISSLFRIMGIIIFFLWLLILGLLLNKRIENPYKFNNILFVLAITFCIVGYSEMNLTNIFPHKYFMPAFFSMLLMPLTLFGLAYVFYNISKSIKSFESNKKVEFGNCIPDMLLLFAFPIGVWFTQPRINKLFLKEEEKINY